MIRQEDVYKIGKIGKAHGVDGEISFMFDDDVFDRVDADYLILLVDGILVPFFFEEYRFKNDSTALVKFCDIGTKDAAGELTGCDVFFPRDMSDSEDGTMTLHEIVGYALIDVENGNRKIGVVTGVDDSTMNILFNVKTDEGAEVLIPASEDFIMNIDVDRQEIHVCLPAGLLDLT